MPTDAPPSPQSSHLGPYRIVRRLAVGGMAEVFEAQREGAAELVVLKVLLPQHAADPEFVAMLADEARLTAQLAHPNLVRVLDVGEGYLALERVDGPTLAQLLRHHGREGGLPPGLALLIAERLLEALAYLHGLRGEDGRSLEIVHRDLSPGNVLVSRRGEVKLGDFGIARHTLRSARTRTGVIKGTVQYMAPEQVAGGGETDRRTDLYGVGLLLFELLTGRPFIDAEREVDLLRRAENPPWRAPSTLRPELDARLDRLLRPALARFPEERYAEAASFLAAVRSLREALAPTEPAALEAELGQLAAGAGDAAAAAVASASAPTIASPPPLERGTRRAGARASWRRPLVLGLGALLAAGAGLAAWQLTRSEGPAGQGQGSGSASGLARSGTASAPLEARAAVPADAGADRTALASSHGADARADAKRKRPPRTPAKVPAARPDARVQAGTPAAEPVAPLRKRLEAALAALRGRGVLEEDLASEPRRRLHELRVRLTAGETAAARPLLEAVERVLGAVSVDRALVEAKAKRVDALLRGRPAAGALRERASTALQELMDGRYVEANRILNQILRLAGR